LTSQSDIYRREVRRMGLLVSNNLAAYGQKYSGPKGPKKNPSAGLFSNAKNDFHTLARGLDAGNKKQGVKVNNNIGIAGILQGSQNYLESLREQRQNMDNAALKVKKLKYNFKNLSSKIVSSKTSYSARQAAGSARREILRLKNEKRKDSENSAEIEAAIVHAKAMERVAKKKVRHLETEELIEAGKGTGEIVLEEDLKETAEAEVKTEEMTDEAYRTLMEQQQEIAEVNARLEQEMQAEMMEAMQAEMMEAMQEEMMEEMQALMEEGVLEELSDMLEAPRAKDMTPEDLKMLKIKHRNSEMKEMAKADAEYLKAVFDILAKETAGDTPAIQGSLTGGVPAFSATPAAVPQSVSEPAPAPASSIDIIL